LINPSSRHPSNTTITTQRHNRLKRIRNRAQVPLGLAAALERLGLGERGRVAIPLALLRLTADGQGQ
jgi:hypothetical protein